jgi:hypothetical protein
MARPIPLAAPVTRTGRPLIRSSSEATWLLLTAGGAGEGCPAWR